MNIYTPEKPYHLSWDITTACNLKCVFCYSASGKRHTAETPELMNVVLDNIVELRPLHLGIGGGEPLLSPYLSDVLVKITSLMGADMPITTIDSMVLYDHEDIIKLVKSLNAKLPQPRIGFYISVHGLEELHDTVVGVKGHFQKVMKSIELLKKHGLEFGMGFVPIRQNVHQIDAVLDLAVEVRATIFNVSQFVPVGRGQYEYNLTPQEYRDLIAWTILQNDQFNYRYVVTHEHWMSVIDKELFQNELFVGCSAGIYYFGLRANGNIVPCQLNNVVLGNIHKDRLLDVWQNHPTLLSWRERKVEGRCGECAFLYKCGGCRCNAASYTGNFLGEDILCPFTEAEVEQQHARLSALPRDGSASSLYLNELPVFRDSMTCIKVPTLATPQSDFLAIRHESIDAIVKLSGDARTIYEMLPEKDSFSIGELRKKFREVTGREMPMDEFSDLVKYKLITCLG